MYRKTHRPKYPVLMSITIIFILCMGWVPTASGQYEPEGPMRTYYVVFLFKGAVRAGRLRVEVHPWMSQRGSKLP
jgi:hypothetical protein